MNIQLFFTSLDERDKNELFNLLIKDKYPLIENISDFTKIDTWIDSNDRLPKMSARLKNILLSCDYNEERNFIFLEQVNERAFLSIRDAGKRSWNEFTYYRDKSI